MVTKHPSADLRAGYRKTFEFALAIALGITIAAFKFSPSGERVSEPPKWVEDPLIDVLPDPTIHRTTPPPPPVRSIVIESTIDVPPDTVDFITELLPNNPPPSPPDDLHEFVVIFETPEPIGGYAILRKSLVYPEMARRVGREGTVVVIAFIDEAGIVQKTEIKEGIGLGCDEAASEAVLKTQFQPATQRGKPVKVRVSIPIRFKLAQ
jgi:protein TonB